MIKAKCLAELKLYDVYFGIYVKRLHSAPIQAMKIMYGKAFFHSATLHSFGARDAN